MPNSRQLQLKIAALQQAHANLPALVGWQSTVNLNANIVSLVHYLQSMRNPCSDLASAYVWEVRTVASAIQSQNLHFSFPGLPEPEIAPELQSMYSLYTLLGKDTSFMQAENEDTSQEDQDYLKSLLVAVNDALKHMWIQVNVPDQTRPF